VKHIQYHAIENVAVCEESEKFKPEKCYRSYYEQNEHSNSARSDICSRLT